MDRGSLQRALDARRPRVRSASWPRAGVAVVWRFEPEPALLLCRRARRDSDPWSGDAAFPGGFAHAGESGLDAARREALEEVGIKLGQPLGRLDGHLALRPKAGIFAIEPWVFAIEGDPVLVPEPGEVAEAAWVPWSALARPSRWGRQRLGRLPILAPTRTWGPYRVWGLTGRILDEVGQRLTPWSAPWRAHR